MHTIGLMSGTSMDAIDAALVRFENDSLSLVAYEQYPIDDKIRSAVRSLDIHSPVNEISRLDALLGKLFADASLKIIQKGGLSKSDIHAIGSHGQTVLHLPNAEYPRTLQIGDPNIIAMETGITTIADFRRMDMAAGGQGAPLAPAFHAHYMSSNNKNRIVLNIGGIANITVLPGNSSIDVTGFDTGPGNGLLDDWNYRHNQTSMDRDSAWAAGGKLHDELLQRLLQASYFSLPPPKSTGRDEFNLYWLDENLKAFRGEISAQDVQATLLQLSARTIADAITAHAPGTQEIYVCGGGVHNSILLDRLRRQLPGISVASTADISIKPDAVEAVTFAWLAKRRMQNLPGNLPSVTGAKREVLLGGIYKAVTSNKL